MQCVSFDNQRPEAFEEQIPFTRQMPYRVQVKHFSEEDVVPLHYGNTLEILLCDCLEGQISIDSQRFDFGDRQLFVIPPHAVHATTIAPCKGTQYVIKISPDDLSHYCDVTNYLECCGCQISQLAYCCPAYSEAERLVDDLIRNDGNLSRCLISILELLLLLSRYTDINRESVGIQSRFKTSTLRELVKWTHQNYMRKVTIEDAAAFVGYSKYHFCARFKALTGMTYLNYLNSVRISHACRLLVSGASVQAVCREVGFENLSYFIQLFRRLCHVTPHQYAQLHKG